MRVRDRNVLRWEGDYWTIVFDGKTVRLRDSKGLRYLAALLRRPGQHIHAADLQAAASQGSSRGERPARSAGHARLAVTKGISGAPDGRPPSHRRRPGDAVRGA